MADILKELLPRRTERSELEDRRGLGRGDAPPRPPLNKGLVAPVGSPQLSPHLESSPAAGTSLTHVYTLPRAACSQWLTERVVRSPAISAQNGTDTLRAGLAEGMPACTPDGPPPLPSPAASPAHCGSLILNQHLAHQTLPQCLPPKMPACNGRAGTPAKQPHFSQI